MQIISLSVFLGSYSFCRSPTLAAWSRCTRILAATMRPWLCLLFCSSGRQWLSV